MRTLTVSRMFPRAENPVSGVFVAEQVRSLLDLGIDVSVLCPIASGPITGWGRGSLGLREDLVEGIPVSYVRYRHMPLRVSTRFEAYSLSRCVLNAVRREHKRSPIAILHGHQVFPTGFATMAAGRHLGIPTVCTAHGSDVHTHPHRSRGIARFTRETLRGVDLTVSVSGDLARRITELEPRVQALEVIYNGVDPKRFSVLKDQALARRELGLPEGGIGICFVGRLVAEKGVSELVAAVRELLGRGHDVWLVLVGGGPLSDELHSQARHHERRMFVAGSVPHSSVSQYLQASDLFALPSHAEGVPVSMLEAMACGLPIIATGVGGIPEVLKDGETGFIVRPRDQATLVMRAEALVEDAHLREKMGRAGRQAIDSGFHWRHGSEKLIDHYRRLASEAPEQRGSE